MCEGRGKNLGASLWCSRSRLRPTTKELDTIHWGTLFWSSWAALALLVLDSCAALLLRPVQAQTSRVPSGEKYYPVSTSWPRKIFVQERSHPWALGISGLAVTGCNLRVSSRKRMLFATAASLMKFVVLRLWLEFFATAPWYFVESRGLYWGHA